MENIFTSIAKFLGIEPLANFLGVEPVVLLVGIAATLYVVYIVWQGRESAVTWYGSVWRLITIPLGNLAFFIILGVIWRKFIDLDWYFDLAILAGVWGVFTICLFIWYTYADSKLPDDLHRELPMRYMVHEPALEPALNALKSGDDRDAFRQLMSLANGGNPGAQLNLGIMYEAGLGVAESKSEAEFWYRKASENGSRVAQYQLGSILTADMLRASAAKQNDPQEFSERVLEGYMWLYLSSLKKQKEAMQGVKRLKRIMSRDQIEAAKRMAAHKLANELTPKI